MTAGSDAADFTPISTLGEFGLIDRIQARIGGPRSPFTRYGIGDDAAVLELPEGARQVLTTDLLIEHVHFDRTYTPMRHLGYKAITANVSDVAAMYASPDAAVVSIGIPNSVSVEMIDSLYEGIVEAAERYGVDIVGGDISGAHKLVISVTVIGHAESNDIVFRNGAMPSDLICVTGALGGSYAGLRILQHSKEQMLSAGTGYQPDLTPHLFVIQRHLRPEARTDSIDRLRSAGIHPTAMIDVSDGLASEVRHICAQSGCSARITSADVPMDDRTRAAAASLDENPLDYALYGGEEYELLFTISPDDADDLRAVEGDFTIIGACLPADGDPEIAMPDGTVQPLMVEGFRHF
ncbi:MAG TPA: thiamine-phosphate kinase [Rhodothermia bacterium]